VANLLNLSIYETLIKHFVLLRSNFFISMNYSNAFLMFIILLIVNTIMGDFKKYLLNTILCNFI